MPDDLHELAVWLSECGCTQVAMESTGVYWHPIWNMLEDRFDLLLVNARHVKTVPGRKTDVKDAEWLAELLRCGLLRGSYVPSRDQREDRELSRYRAQLIGDRTRTINRLHKTLEGANIKLTSVVSDVRGVSARQILARLVSGTTAPAVLAQLAKGRLREKIPTLERALAGSFRSHHRFLVAEILAHLDWLDELIERLGDELDDRQRPFERQRELLRGIPGIGQRAAEVIVTELGTDMSRFPTDAHCASWVALCPGNKTSGGKRLSGRMRKGNRYLRAILIECAYAAGRTKSFLGAMYRRLAKRLGKKKAAVALAHRLLLIAYHLLKKDVPYQELGADYYLTLKTQTHDERMIRDLERRGYTVTKHEAA